MRTAFQHWLRSVYSRAVIRAVDAGIFAQQLENEGAGNSLMCRQAWLAVVLNDLITALCGRKGPSVYETLGPIQKKRTRQ